MTKQEIRILHQAYQPAVIDQKTYTLDSPYKQAGALTFKNYRQYNSSNIQNISTKTFKKTSKEVSLIAWQS